MPLDSLQDNKKLEFGELPKGALLSHVVLACAIDMRHGEVEVYAFNSVHAAKLDCAIKPEELWSLEADGKLECIGGTSGDEREEEIPYTYRYTHYIKI
jgi:hypothetical protein